MTKYSVMFFSTYNSCRSQIAEMLAGIFASDIIEPYSAGVEPLELINDNAARVMREMYGVDINDSQKPKSFCDVPKTDIVIYFLSDDIYPELHCKYSETWDIEELADKPIKLLRDSTAQIEKLILNLKARLEAGEIDLS